MCGRFNDVHAYLCVLLLCVVNLKKHSLTGPVILPAAEFACLKNVRSTSSGNHFLLLPLSTHIDSSAHGGEGCRGRRSTWLTRARDRDKRGTHYSEARVHIFLMPSSPHEKRNDIYLYQAENKAENNLSWTITKKIMFWSFITSDPPTQSDEEINNTKTPGALHIKTCALPTLLPVACCLHSAHHPQLSRTTYSKNAANHVLSVSQPQPLPQRKKFFPYISHCR